jgi:hypothetical protein
LLLESVPGGLGPARDDWNHRVLQVTLAANNAQAAALHDSVAVAALEGARCA